MPMDKPTFIFQLSQLDKDPAAALEENIFHKNKEISILTIKKKQQG
jgi:hypothetical protein